MTVILIFLFFSFLVYYTAFRKCDSVFELPSLGQITFFRDYLLLTIIPYIFYYYNDNYNNHYILSQLTSKDIIIHATIHAFVFISFFLFTYKFLSGLFRSINEKIQIIVYEKKLLFYLKLIATILIIYFIISSFQNKAGIVGIFTFDIFEIAHKRAEITQSASFLTRLNKIVIRCWIPMFSYLFFYFYLKNKYLFKKTDKIILVSFLSTSVLASIYSFEKSSIFINVLGFIAVAIYAGNRLKKRFLLFIPFAGIALVSVMYFLTYKEKIVDSAYLINIIIHRIMTQCAGSIMAIDYFSVHEKLGFSGVSRMWASAMSSNFESVYGLLIDYYVPESIDISGALSSFATGDAFGLFGYFGIPFSGIIIGIYYSFLESTKFTKFLSYIFIGVYGYYFSHSIVASSFYSFIWPTGFILNLLPFLIIVLLSSKIRHT